jgi:hypothetical protein
VRAAADWLPPRRVGFKGGLHRTLKNGSIAERYLRLNTAIIGVKHIAHAQASTASTARNKMIDLPHRRHNCSNCLWLAALRRLRVRAQFAV